MLLLLFLAAATSVADGQAVVNTANMINCLSLATNAYANNCNYGGVNSGGVKFIDPFYQNSWTSGDATTYPMTMTGPTFLGYNNIVVSNPEPQTFATLQADNLGNCATAMPLVINQAVTYKQSSTWSLSATVTLSNTVSEELEIPGEGEISDTTTMTVSTTASTSSTSSSTFTQQITSTFSAQPGQNLEATLMVNAETITANFQYQYSFGGYLPIWFNNKVDAVCFNVNSWGPSGGPAQSNFHWNWFTSINSVMEDALTLAAQGGDPNGYCTGFTYADFTGNGVFKSNKGISAVAAANTIGQTSCPNGRKLVEKKDVGTEYRIFTDDLKLGRASSMARHYYGANKTTIRPKNIGSNKTTPPSATKPKPMPKPSPKAPPPARG